MISAFGDMFLMADNKIIYWLDVGGGELKMIASDIDDFERKLNDISLVNEWFMIDLTTELRLSDKSLKAG